MNFLFVHQNFPGQYLHIVRSLNEDNKRREGTHQIVFMTEPNQNQIAGLRKVTYARPPKIPPNSVSHDVRDLEMATQRAHAAYKGALQIRALGFKPDIIIGHHGWGEMLNLVDVFPGVPILGYFEFYYKIHDSDVNFDPQFPMPEARYSAVRAKNAVNHLALALEHYGQVPTQWQFSTYPKWAQSQIRIIEEGVDLDLCKPDPTLRKKNLKVGPLTVTPKQKLLTYVARNLEPYRGFHTFMRALPKILEERPDLVVSIVGGDDISYGSPPAHGTWRQVMMNEVGDKIDLTRVHFMGKVPYDDHLALLKRSDAHLYLTYPFVASWSLREALACGCQIIGGDTETVTEFIKHDKNGLITPTLNPNAVAETILGALADTKRAARLRAAARVFAEKHLAMDDYLARFRAYIEEITGKVMIPAEPVEVPAPAKVKKPAKARAKASTKPAQAA
ncbi:MAG TPA: glycosyltransferase [Acidocella sp.]|nr:MAG: glycosyl transferase [Acidocella sp. 20-61-6]HQT45858.1 glycosyltransferase [Acidocella sp.]